jgi:hypothetical protein
MFQCLRFGEALVVVVLSNTPQTISDFSFEHCRYGHGDCGIGFHHLFEELKLALLMALGHSAHVSASEIRRGASCGCTLQHSTDN